MSNVTNRWKTVQTLAEAKKMILDSEQGFEPDNFDWVPFQDKIAILDFGCGIGRNMPAILERAPEAHIIGYDSQNMLGLAKEYLVDELHLVSEYAKIDWIPPPVENLKKFSYDLILAIIVFQHISEQELRKILSILRNQLTNHGRLAINSRASSDDYGKSVWKIISDYFVLDPKSHLDWSAAVNRNNHQHALFLRA